MKLFEFVFGFFFSLCILALVDNSLSKVLYDKANTFCNLHKHCDCEIHISSKFPVTEYYVTYKDSITKESITIEKF